MKMKQVVISMMVLLMVSLFVVGCLPKVKTVEGLKQDMADEYASGKHDDKLIGTVSFDTGCPKNKIKVTYRSDQAGSGMYKLDA